VTVLVVDGANVVGSRPDGWWRDRAGAAARLATRLGAASAAGLLDPLGAPSRVVLVVEGAARAAEVEPVAGLSLLRAPADGDAAIVDLVGELVAGGERVLVVTADRGLRSRVTEAGGEVVGPGVLLRALDAL